MITLAAVVRVLSMPRPRVGWLAFWAAIFRDSTRAEEKRGSVRCGMWALSRIENASRHSIDSILVLSADGRRTSVI